MAQRRFLNVQFGNTKTEIDVDGIVRLSQVQDKIKKKYSASLTNVDTARIELYDQQNNLVQRLDKIPGEYFQYEDEGGLFLRIGIASFEQQPLFGPVSSENSADATLQALSLRLLTQATGEAVTGEGIDRRSDPIIRRSELLKHIFDTVNETGMALVRSPPMTGKTSTCALLHENINSRVDCLAFSMTAADLQENQQHQPLFSTAFEKRFGLKWADFVELASMSRLNVYFLLDEAQVISASGIYFLSRICRFIFRTEAASVRMAVIPYLHL